jgi:hypothetical protein
MMFGQLEYTFDPTFEDQDPLFTPKIPVVCTGFAVCTVPPSKIRRDFRKISPLRSGWTDPGVQVAPVAPFIACHR